MVQNNIKIINSVEYKLISDFYSNRTANRSKVPLINHINEGLVILQHIDSSIEAMKAFCLHPLLQSDIDLKQNYKDVATSSDPTSMLLAMEYRSVANEFLSNKVTTDITKEYIVRLSPLVDVNNMLIADKVQNYKDFVIYHKGTHPRSSELDQYFNIWLDTLGISKVLYENLCKLLEL